MTPGDGRLAKVLALVASEAQASDDRPGAAGWMQRLCRVATRHLPALGVGVSLFSDTGDHITFAASDPVCERIEELQFTLGEGPCLDAHAAGRPVLTPDIAEESATHWMGYADAVRDHGVHATFAFPLQVGAARLGALVVYRDVVGSLSIAALTLALTFAEAATGALLDAQSGRRALGPVRDDEDDTRFERYQAQGMVMVQLGVDLTEAMARMRAHAYSHDRRLTDVANDIVAGKLTLDPDGV